MDESWRMRMGMANHSRRRSTDAAALNRARHFGYANRNSDADDFADVFGGPPRNAAGRKMSADFTNCTSFYEEIFRIPDMAAPAKNIGRSLRSFSIPSKNDEFYSDIFGNDGIGRSSSRGKSNSSSVMSSEELSPLRPGMGEDIEISSFASKLRPINIPCRWNSSTMTPAAEHRKNKRGMPAAFPPNSPSGSENQYMESFGYKSSYQGFSSQNVTSPDIINLEPNSYQGTKASTSDLDLQSSSSGLSSWEDKAGLQVNDDDENDTMQEQDHDDDEIMSSYVIEINSDHYREWNDDAIDEAVAWAKEKYQQHSPQKDDADMQGRPKEGEQTELNPPLPEDGELDKWTSKAKQQSQYDMELKLLEKEVELWSCGKKTNIRLLLSSLHQILWPNSSWHAIRLTNLIDSSHVKKAYQKAQLCLHPDKMQQRGATPTQKYVAAKVFAILKDAWDAFITEDVLLIR